MSSNSNHIINLSNYEEWFVLYMDNELSAGEKGLVEAFVLLHPYLQEELDVLLSTKLPAEEITFLGKEDLKANAMKLNAVDESLLLYIDNELSAADKKTVEGKLLADKNLGLQYNLLRQTKLDASEIISYPDKKELYRHTEKVISFAWMRVAAAIVLILFATLFFVLNQNDKSIVPPDVVRTNEPVKPKSSRTSINNTAAINNSSNSVLQQESTAGSKTEKQNKIEPTEKKTIVDLPKKQVPQQDVAAAQQKPTNMALPTVEPIKIEVAKLTEQPAVALNNSTAISVVTSATPATYNDKAPGETAGSDEDFKSKKTSAKGLLRRVSRFIGRRTGIGTVNADNEMLVGMVSLKLN